MSEECSKPLSSCPQPCPLSSFCFLFSLSPPSFIYYILCIFSIFPIFSSSFVALIVSSLHSSLLSSLTRSTPSCASPLVSSRHHPISPSTGLLFRVSLPKPEVYFTGSSFSFLTVRLEKLVSD